MQLNYIVKPHYGLGIPSPVFSPMKHRVPTGKGG